MNNKIFSPNTGNIIGNWSNTKEKNIEKKIINLSLAFEELNSIKNRIFLLNKLKKTIINNKKILSQIIINECGKTFKEANDEITYANSFVDFSIYHLKNHEPINKVGNHIINLRSRGISFLITPYNDPLAGLIRKIAPAIASGSPTLIKCSSLSIMLTKQLEKLISKSDLKKFVKFIYCNDIKIVSNIIIDKRIKLISFTGSTQAGNDIRNLKTSFPKHYILELGGINPAFILDNKNLEKNIEQIIIRKIKAGGQACSSINKVYVMENLKDKFIKIFSEKASYYKLMNTSLYKKADYGPVRTLNHLKFLKSINEKSIKNHGKEIYKSSCNIDDKGYFFPLTLIQTSLKDMIFDTQETFGPLLSVAFFKDENKLFNIIEQNRYKLVSYFFTKNERKYRQRILKLNFGSVGINTTAIQGPHIPTGGNDYSGIGREGGKWGFKEYLTTCNYVLK